MISEREGAYRDMSKRYDLIIKNARVYDGSGRPWFDSDIAVVDGFIAGIGKTDASDAETCVDAGGRAVAQGSSTRTVIRTATARRSTTRTERSSRA